MKRKNILPSLPSKVSINQYGNIIAHNALDHKINANVNIITLYAEELERRGFDPQNLIVETKYGDYKIFKQNDYWQVNFPT